MPPAAELSDRELRLARMRSQRLLPGNGVKSVTAAAKAALTIQAQDVPAATLAVRARTSGLSAARLGWKSAGRTVEVETERGAMTALPAALKSLPAGEPLVRLLGAYDHYLLGWKGRSLTVPERHQRKVHPGAGYIKATAFLDGLAFGTWKMERSGDSLVVEVHPFGRLPRGARPGLEREAAEIGRFFEAEAELQIVRG